MAQIDDYRLLLSARKYNAGDAYIEYWFSHKIRKLTFDISYYSYSDVLSRNDSTLSLWSLNYDQNNDSFYWLYLIDFISEGISASPSNPSRFELSFVENEPLGFLFSTTAPATGNIDLGRVCLQNITIVHDVLAHDIF